MVLVISVFFVLQNFWNPLNLVVFPSQSEGNEVRLSKDDNGREIAVKIGDVLHIELERFGGTGYEWYLDKSYEKYFELMKEGTETLQSRNLVGTPVLRTWELTAVEKGETEIRLFLYRNWEGRDKPIETFKVKVKIH
jgi:predicted secreted protein